MNLKRPALLFLFCAMPALGGEPDGSCTRLDARPARARIDLRRVFAPAASPVRTDTGVSVTLPVMEVVIARIGSDGKPVLACVDTEAAARRFLEAPPDRLPAGAAKEK